MTKEYGVDILLGPEHKSEVEARRNKKELERTKADLARAGIDGLTGLLMKKFLEPNLQKSINDLIIGENKRPPGTKKDVLVLFFDIDNFKLLNDTYGHDAGDLALSVGGTRVKGVLHREGDSAYRFGGEEMVAILVVDKALSADEIRKLAEDKQEEINNLLYIKAKNLETNKEEKVPIVFSMGCASFMEVSRSKEDSGVVDPKELIGKADSAMYKDKKTTKEERLRKAREALGLPSLK